LERETNSRQIAPKHHGKPAIIRDQKTRPVNKIDNFAKSAKPPSPVQIRAAPPFFLEDSRDPACSDVRGDFVLLRKALDSLLVPKSDLCKSLHRDELSARDLRRGGGSEDLHFQPRAVLG
jgi:hypothetical protein